MAGNGRNGKYTAQQFIAAMPGTGGIITAIADKLGCSWHTAKRYIDTYPTIKTAHDNERNKITDKAQHNIIKAIKGGDLQMSKWWLQVKDVDFVPIERREIKHQGDPDAPIAFTVGGVNLDDAI